jgi:hypothetical protein
MVKYSERESTRRGRSCQQKQDVRADVVRAQVGAGDFMNDNKYEDDGKAEVREVANSCENPCNTRFI